MRRLFMVALAAVASACSGTGHIDVGVTASPLSAAGSETTDAPRLLVTINEVKVHVAGEDGDDADADAGAKADGDADDTDGSGWVTVYAGPPIEVDLRTAAGAEVLLGDGVDVSPGKITQIRLVLADEAKLVTADGTQTVACPSCTTSGLKLITTGKLQVAEGETLHLQLVFDALASVAAELDGLRLNPVVKIAAAVTAG